MTLFSEAASQVATRDRTATADHLLDVACRQVLDAFATANRYGLTLPLREAEDQLTSVAERCERILGRDPEPFSGDPL